MCTKEDKVPSGDIREFSHKLEYNVICLDKCTGVLVDTYMAMERSTSLTLPAVNCTNMFALIYLVKMEVSFFTRPSVAVSVI